MLSAPQPDKLGGFWMVWEPCGKEPTLSRASCLQHRGDTSGFMSLEHCSDIHYRHTPLWPVLPRDGHRLMPRSNFLSCCDPGFVVGLADLAVHLDSEKMKGRLHPCPVTCGCHHCLVGQRPLVKMFVVFDAAILEAVDLSAPFSILC